MKTPLFQNNKPSNSKNIVTIPPILEQDQECKSTALNNIKKGLEEMSMFKKGKLKTTSTKPFLKE